MRCTSLCVARRGEVPLTDGSLCVALPSGPQFATLTTVGFGDVSANTNAERVYALVLMLVGAVLFATIVGRMSALATAVNQKAAEHQQIHDNLAEFMRRREIPKPLRQRMRAYFQYKTLHNVCGRRARGTVLCGGAGGGHARALCRMAHALRRDVTCCSLPAVSRA